MTISRFSRSIASAVLLALLAACASTKITDTWQAPGFERKAFNNVLVVAVTGNKTNRILFERGFVKHLASKGIKATASVDVIGSGMPTKEAVQAYVDRSDIQYVIATRYGGTEVQKEYVPESVRTYYTGPYYGNYGGYWNHYGSTNTMVREAYVDTKTTVTLTTSIYDIKTTDLVWVGRSSTFEVGAVSVAADELAGQVVNHISR